LIPSSDPKINAWILQEYHDDEGYWQDRAKNGTGLIQQIARLVLGAGRR